MSAGKGERDRSRPADLRAVRPVRVFLIGFMGAGKSTVGGLVAQRLGVPFVDLDRSIEEDRALSIPEIFEKHGEEGFRRLEVEALNRASQLEAVVIATGGGIACREENVATMRGAGPMIWLNPAVETLMGRLQAARGSRPLFDTVEGARELFERRLPGYRRADYRVDVGAEESNSEVAERIVKLLGRD